VFLFLVEIPPTYEDTFEPLSESDLDTSGQWFGGKSSVPSHGARGVVAQPADRSSSLQRSRPPRVRSRRHFSDGTDPHRRKRYPLVHRGNIVATDVWVLLMRSERNIASP